MYFVKPVYKERKHFMLGQMESICGLEQKPFGLVSKRHHLGLY